MGEVVQFKSKKHTPRNDLEKRLDSMLENMQRGDAMLKRSYKTLEDMEMKAHKLKEQFTRVLIDYANRVGHENVPLQYINSALVTVLFDDTGFTIASTAPAQSTISVTDGNEVSTE
jgi:hypothetical protein